MPTEATAAPPREPVGKTRAGKDREEQLIRVAAKMFYDRGYDGTTLQDVANELGLLKGSLYYYIESKDDLLYAVVARQHRSAMALVEECGALDAPPEERLRAFIRGYARSLDRDHIFVSVYLREMERLSPERRKLIVDERRDYVQWVVDLLDECKATGVFRQDFDSEIVMRGILGMLNTAYRWFNPRGKHSSEKIIDEFAQLIFHGLAVQDRPGVS
jgi:AcrR family transcriptional regulator